MTAWLSWHLQNFVAITVWQNGWEWSKLSIKFELQWKNHYITHRGRVTHICVSKLTIISSDNGLSPGRRQAIIWTNAGILLIGPLRTNFSEISIEIYAVSIKKMHLKMTSWKWWPFCLGLNVSNVPKPCLSAIMYIYGLCSAATGKFSWIINGRRTPWLLRWKISNLV